MNLGEALIWIYRFFLIGLVGIGVVALVMTGVNARIDKKPLEASKILDLIADCYNKDIDYCVGIDNNWFIKYENKTYGNDYLKVLCEVKEKGVKLEQDIYCKKTKVYDNKAKKFIDVFIAIK